MLFLKKIPLLVSFKHKKLARHCHKYLEVLRHQKQKIHPFYGSFQEQLLLSVTYETMFKTIKCYFAFSGTFKIDYCALILKVTLINPY